MDVPYACKIREILHKICEDNKGAKLNVILFYKLLSLLEHPILTRYSEQLTSTNKGPWKNG